MDARGVVYLQYWQDWGLLRGVLQAFGRFEELLWPAKVDR
jgi:hypothetical protein